RVLGEVGPALGEFESTSMAPPFVTVTFPEEGTLGVLLSVGSRMRMPGLEGVYDPRATPRAVTASGVAPQIRLKKRTWLYLIRTSAKPLWPVNVPALGGMLTV